MSAHTPGPWTARMQMSKSGEMLGWMIEHPNGRIGWSSYATAYPNQGEKSPYTIGGNNAFLIAASPDLLAAAKCAVSVLILLEPEIEGLGHSADNVLPMLRAAIAKAEGKS